VTTRSISLIPMNGAMMPVTSPTSRAIRRSSPNRSRITTLTMSFSCTTPSRRVPSATASGLSRWRAMPSEMVRSSSAPSTLPIDASDHPLDPSRVDSAATMPVTPGCAIWLRSARCGRLSGPGRWSSSGWLILGKDFRETNIVNGRVSLRWRPVGRQRLAARAWSSSGASLFAQPACCSPVTSKSCLISIST